MGQVERLVRPPEDIYYQELCDSFRRVRTFLPSLLRTRGANHARLLIERARDADHAANQVAFLDVGENALAHRHSGLEEVLTDVGQYVAAGAGRSLGIVGYDRDSLAQRLIRHVFLSLLALRQGPFAPSGFRRLSSLTMGPSDSQP